MINLEYQAKGIPPPGVKLEHELVTELDRERVKEHREDKKVEAIKRIAAIASGGGRGNVRGRGIGPSVWRKMAIWLRKR